MGAEHDERRAVDEASDRASFTTNGATAGRVIAWKDHPAPDGGTTHGFGCGGWVTGVASDHP